MLQMYAPLVPISNISMDEVTKYARELAKRVGSELEIPVYCYENAAFKNERKNLANCRSGEYEGLKKNLRIKIGNQILALLYLMML